MIPPKDGGNCKDRQLRIVAFWGKKISMLLLLRYNAKEFKQDQVYFNSWIMLIGGLPPFCNRKVVSSF